MVEPAGGQVLPAKSENFLWHAADASALRALDLALRPATAQDDRSARTLRHRAGSPAYRGRPSRPALARRAVGLKLYSSFSRAHRLVAWSRLRQQSVLVSRAPVS